MKKSRGALVQSYGCSANFGEGEQTRGLLEDAGIRCSGPNENPDLIVLNVCTVKGNASALKAFRAAREEHPKKRFLLTGCVTRELAELARKIDPEVSLSTTNDLLSVGTLARKSMNETVENFHRSHPAKAGLRHISENPVQGIVPVCNGCLDHCSFCSTVLVKGALYSYPEKKILDDVRRLVEQGAREIWITGQDAGCYGFDTSTSSAHRTESNLATLLEKVCALKGNFLVRAGMGNPRHTLRYAEHMAEVLQHPKMFKFLHLPVQCGSDRVLESMGRKHSAKDYLDLARLFREAVPELTLSTDIIVGFPGETEEEFVQTLDLIQKTRPSVCNRTRFVPRKGTPAMKMKADFLSKEIKKDRSRRVTELFKKIALENNENWVGWKGRVTVNAPGKNESWQARNHAYRQVVLQGNYSPGQDVDVIVTKARTFHLEATEMPR